jgi:hypothetical protein
MADFPAVAARHRQARGGMSLRSLARALCYDHGYLGKVLRGDKPCPPSLARSLDELLNAGGEIVAAAARSPALPRDTDDGPVAPELVGYFSSQLAGHYTADMHLGPRYLIPTVTAQAELIGRLTRTADGGTRRGLLEAGTAYAALLGWLHQDAGDLPASARWRDATVSLAHRSGDPQLVSYALSNQAMLAADGADGRAVIDFARAARAGARRLSPKVRVIALSYEAQGQAMLGARREADELLDQAAALVPRVDDEQPWGNSCRRTPHHVDVTRATCWGRTGDAKDARDAARLWEAILGEMSPDARRDNAVFAARHASALARVPDPDAAIDAAERAAAAAGTGSARLRREVLAIPGNAREWLPTRQGRRLREIVASVA